MIKTWSKRALRKWVWQFVLKLSWLDSRYVHALGIAFWVLIFAVSAWAVEGGMPGRFLFLEGSVAFVLGLFGEARREHHLFEALLLIWKMDTIYFPTPCQLGTWTPTCKIIANKCQQSGTLEPAGMVGTKQFALPKFSRSAIPPISQHEFSQGVNTKRHGQGKSLVGEGRT